MGCERTHFFLRLSLLRPYSLRVTPNPLSIPDDESLQEVTYSLDIDDLSVIDTTSFDIDTGVIVFNRVPNANGLVNFILTATDNGEPSSSSFSIDFTINILAYNDAPVISGASDLDTDEDVPIQILLTDLAVNDVEDDALTLYVNEGDNYSVLDNEVVPDYNYNGPLTVDVYVLDDGDPTGGSNIWPVSVTVNPVNDDPEFTLSWDAYGDNQDEFVDTVSYTHLTLPTIYSV